MSDVSKNEMIPFYTFYLLGRDSMCETYAKVLTMINDDSRIQQIQQQSSKIFTEDMTRLLSQAVPEVKIYGRYGA